ncbi:anucleate primary sterigmata protein A [Phyllosticta capitalensis]
MASPSKAISVEGDADGDPFGPSTSSNNADSHRKRYAGFDTQTFSVYSDSSPSATKRALEAHLAETERRLREASQLGTILVQQRKELGERLKEVESQSDSAELGAELRSKLIELEREFNEVGKDTARAFIPKTRVPSYHASLDADGNSVFASEAHPSPSKLSVPTRKQRNQQPNRIHDIKLATEISSSLLNQVRELQAALAEKDELLKQVNAERSHLEVEVEGLTQRLRALDESEQRYKDENWNLETKIQELTAQQKQAVAKEQRLNQNISSSNSEKASIERELEELKQAHGKLNDDYQAMYKQHEAEIMGLRRNVSSGETERSALQHKIDELISQNQELVQAVAYHRRLEESGSGRDSNHDAEDQDTDQDTPENSPPPSPTKFTPRHSHLETETLKSSLQHAHRMIQNLKNNIHREKTEKMELRRLLQETKDELDIARKEAANGFPNSKKRRPNEKQDLFKKPPRPDRLGMARGSRDEIIVDDGDWEDNDEHDVPETPSRRPQPSIGGVGLSPFSRRVNSASFTRPSTEVLQTVAESSDAFETAHERDEANETDAFHTGVETLDASSTEEDTEADDSDRGTIRTRRYSRMSDARPGRDSYLSTASTSGDEIDDSEVEVKTPKRTEQPRYRLKISRGGRRSVQSAAEMLNNHVSKSPSASFMSDGSQAEPDGGKSLLAELGNFSERDSDAASETGSDPGTPGRASIISPQESPELRKTLADKALIRKASLARPPMVDSSMNTEPMSPTDSKRVSSTTAALGAAISGVAGFGLGRDQDEQATPEQRGDSTPGLAPSALEPELTTDGKELNASTTPAVSPQPLSISELNAQEVEPVEPSLAHLEVSAISSLTSAPVEPAAPAPPKLDLSSLLSLHSEPVNPAAPVAPKLDLSSVSSLQSEPVEPQTEAPAKLDLSSVSSLHSVPVEPEAPSNPKLQLSSVSALHSEPIEPEAPSTPKLQLSSLSALHSEPVEPEVPSAPQVIFPPFRFSPISSLHSEPSAPPTARKVTPNHDLSSVVSYHSQEPVDPEIPAPKEAPVSNLSSILSLGSEPVAAESPKVPALHFSPVLSQNSEPIATEFAPRPKVEVKPADLQLSSISSLHSDPVSPEAPKVEEPADLRVSAISSLHSAPISPEAPTFTPSTFSAVSGQAIEPVSRPAPKPVAVQTEPVEVENRSVSTDDKTPTLSYTNILAQNISPEEANMPGVLDPAAFQKVYAEIMAKERRAITTTQVANVDPIEAKRDMRHDSPAMQEGKEVLQSIPENDVDSRSPMVEMSTQTLISAEELDGLMKGKHSSTILAGPPSPTRSLSLTKTPGSPKKDSKTPRKPASTSSLRSARVDAPPLPSDHKEVIAAASQKGPSTPRTPSVMGPPVKPASAYKNQNSSHASQLPPRTPSGSISGARPVSPHSVRDGTTPRARLQANRSEVSSPTSRRTSVSSFASEIDQRFNIPINPVGRDVDSTTDPRIIQAITQTMIGEYLWKYTRKAGREEMSENRHRRFFWVHPYTRTLYWSDQDPATAGKNQLKAKSVQIEDVRVENDDNPYPPGLHRKSLIVITPGRYVKFTATTSQRHETWFNALSYLLLRTSQERDGEESVNDRSITAEDAREFNPSYGGSRTTSRMTGRSRVSLSSYNSRTTKASSPRRSRLDTITKRRAAAERGTLTTPSPSSMSGRLSTFSGMFGHAGTLRGSFSSRRSRLGTRDAGSAAGNGSIYDASVIQDSAEDLRQVIEAQERDADRLENVRACCDGKHDVGSLSKKPHHHHHHTTRRSKRTSSIGASTMLSANTDPETRTHASAS